MIRPVLAVAAGLLCALLGFRRAAALRAEEVRLRRWQELLAQLSLIISEATLSLPEAMCCAADGLGQADALLSSIAEDMLRDPLASPADAFAARCPPCPEREPLLRMLHRLGRGTLESRCLALEQCGAALALLTEKAASRAAKDTRLYQTLGMTGGVALALLLL